MIRRLFIALCVCLVVLGAAGYLGLRYFRRSQLTDALNSAMGKDAAYSETVLKVEWDSNNITYGEFFKLCDEAVDRRQKLVIELRGAYPGLNDDLKATLVGFLNKENDFVRAKRRLYWSEMEFSSASKGLATYKSTYFSYRTDGIDSRVDRVVDKARENIKSAESFLKLYGEAIESEQAAVKATKTSGILVSPTFRKFEETNKNRGTSSLETAKAILAALG